MTHSAEPARTPSWFDAEDAPGRRDIDTCIHCGLCLTACPTYRELKIEPDSPRGRLYLMRGLAEGRIAPDDDVIHHLDQCLGCRACEPVCPAGVPYGRLLEETRGQLNRRAVRASLPRLMGEWALRALMPRRDRMHRAADLLRLSQRGPIAAMMRSSRVRGLLPRFAVQGYDLTPQLAPRAERALERVASRLPAGARIEARAAAGDVPAAMIFKPAAPAASRAAFFTTCVMDVMFPHVNQELVRLLVLAGVEVVVPHAQTCCGALHAHAGLRREAKELARRNLKAFASADPIVTDSAGCGAALRDWGHLLHETPEAPEANRFSARVRDISELLVEVKLPAPGPLSSRRDPSRPLRVAYHDACHLVHGQKVRNQPRELLRRLPGVEMVELPNADWCCGSAGVYNLTHPAMADAQLDHKLDAIERSGAEVVVASNPGCLLHMVRGARARGMNVEIVHLIELLGRAYPAPR
ncbi:MAG TPA: (Fe-S)-binding protein [Candidatus Limnocylindria bacterium]|nr:(Fe-S)-binding protein [Candidatus Limnocylindria bacterium]